MDLMTSGQKMDGRVLRLRGLPYTADENAVVEFFDGFSVLQVYLLQRNGENFRYFGEILKSICQLCTSN